MPPGARRTALAIVAVLFLSYCYFFQGGGWNQNTRLDFARAITEHRTLHIDAYATNTGDEARVGGHVYSDKAPGEPLLLVVPVAAVLAGAHAAGIRVAGEEGVTLLAYAGTLTTSSIPAIVAALTLFWVALALRLRVAAAAVAALAFGLASPMWAYATLLWASALATACLMIAFAAAVALRAPGLGASRRSFLLALLGLAAGWAAITDYACAPAAGIIVVLALVSLGAARSWRALAWIGAGAAFPFVVILGYNAASFASPFHVGYGSEIGFPALHRGVMGVTYPKPAVLAGLLFGTKRGLLLLAPELALAPLGLALLARRREVRAPGVAAIGIVVYFLLYNAAYAYWTGGWSYGPRLLAPAIAFLCLGLAACWDRARVRAQVAIAVLVAIGATFAFGAVATTPQLAGTAASPLTSVVWPALHHGAVAIGGQSYLEKYPDTRLSRTSADDAWNLGTRAGLRGVWSLLPLITAWAVVALALTYAFRHERKRRVLRTLS